MTEKEKYFKQYWDKNAVFSTPCNGGEYTQADWRELYQEIFDMGWECRKEAEYKRMFMTIVTELPPPLKGETQ